MGKDLLPISPQYVTHKWDFLIAEGFKKNSRDNPNHLKLPNHHLKNFFSKIIVNKKVVN